METVSELKYVEGGHLVHGAFLLQLLMQLHLIPMENLLCTTVQCQLNGRLEKEDFLLELLSLSIVRLAFHSFFMGNFRLFGFAASMLCGMVFHIFS